VNKWPDCASFRVHRALRKGSIGPNNVVIIPVRTKAT
jgi:hypothetical protein